ncbi:GNAT family N-acetyltransferase [Solitalea sp. MAHUQ-68]|uniref:GNAT family N-acetyltransferase n=1 Tax=Solitalea agri TaxID=2953739 RepID=A0A9X2F164_9SPHI|nr:GNAT family protein [Solitalea agri]MCO4292204.1 GNAT family N-acetyltransferase [Solitalea agri]
MKLSIRELTINDIELIVNYWTMAKDEYLVGMGVEVNKLPTKEQWVEMLSEQLNQSFQEKKSYCLIWEVDGKPVGHSNVNKIVFGEEAYMHLHFWDVANRTIGAGTELVKLGLPYFFQNLQLKNLYCEPYALNQAPNKTLKKVGFKFEKEYITVPGFINFEQPVNRWVLSREEFESLTSLSQ